MKAVFFSEEYSKVTKGLFTVWSLHAVGASQQFSVEVLLNREHWAHAEARERLAAIDGATVHRLPFRMPSFLVLSRSRLRSLQALQIILGNIVNAFCSPFVILYLYAWLRRQRPFVVFSHAGGWPAGPLGRWIVCAAFLARVPNRILVIHSHPAIHGSSDNRLARIAAFALAPFAYLRARTIERCASAIVTVSDSVKSALEKQVFRRVVDRIHNGIDLSDAKRAALSAAPLIWQPKGLAIGFVGALHAMKGPQVLLDAFKEMDMKCELALLGPGDPAFVNTLQRQAAQCDNPVSFLGFHDDVDNFLEKIDLLVVPSIAFESFGMVILEAMKHRVPVICSDYGGMKEIVVHGVTGLIVPSGDVAALTAAMTSLLADAETRGRMGARGFERLSELFTAERMTTQYNRLLTDPPN